MQKLLWFDTFILFYFSKIYRLLLAHIFLKFHWISMCKFSIRLQYVWQSWPTRLNEEYRLCRNELVNCRNLLRGLMMTYTSCLWWVALCVGYINGSLGILLLATVKRLKGGISPEQHGADCCFTPPLAKVKSTASACLSVLCFSVIPPKTAHRLLVWVLTGM